MQRAVELLRAGQVVALPTETVYGLAARIDDHKAIEKIFTTKQRPFFDPLIVHVASVEQARRLTTEWSRASEVLANSFWPGPLTLVLPKADSVNPLITAALSTVAIRMPRHASFLSVIQQVGVPLAAPSANRFGRTSPTSAEHVRSEFENQVYVLDGGPCEIGIESTIVSLFQKEDHVELEFLRSGSITASQIERVLDGAKINYEIVKTRSEAPLSPGQLPFHYMPEIPLILVHSKDFLLWPDEQKREALSKHLKDLPAKLMGLSTDSVLKAKRFSHLDLPQDPGLAARYLYARLREAKDSGADVLVFVLEPLHDNDSWQAVLDRIKKAAFIKEVI